jgi:hypothetical protein
MDINFFVVLHSLRVLFDFRKKIDKENILIS